MNKTTSGLDFGKRPQALKLHTIDHPAYQTKSQAVQAPATKVIPEQNKTAQNQPVFLMWGAMIITMIIIMVFTTLLVIDDPTHKATKFAYNVPVNERIKVNIPAGTSFYIDPRFQGTLNLGATHAFTVTVPYEVPNNIMRGDNNEQRSVTQTFSRSIWERTQPNPAPGQYFAEEDLIAEFYGNVVLFGLDRSNWDIMYSQILEIIIGTVLALIVLGGGLFFIRKMHKSKIPQGNKETQVIPT